MPAKPMSPKPSAPKAETTAPVAAKSSTGHRTIVVPAVRQPITIEHLADAAQKPPARKKVIVVMSGAKRTTRPAAERPAADDTDFSEESTVMHARPADDEGYTPSMASETGDTDESGEYAQMYEDSSEEEIHTDEDASYEDAVSEETDEDDDSDDPKPGTEPPAPEAPESDDQEPTTEEPQAPSEVTSEAVSSPSAEAAPEREPTSSPEAIASGGSETDAAPEPSVDRTPPAIKALKAKKLAAAPAADAAPVQEAPATVKVVKTKKTVVAPAAVAAQAEPLGDDPEPIKFADLGLSEQVLKAISDLGFEAPTAIQAGAIPPLLAGRDLIGQAQTGTGKTAAFALPLVQMVDPKQNVIQAIILEPTRELAIQVADGIHKFAKYAGLNVVPVYGGQPLDRQFRALRAGAHIVVGTPGRVLDHLRRGSIALDQVRFCVLDEADEMLALGFLEEVETILAEMPKERQTAFFSATMAPRVLALTQQFLNNPQRVKIESKRRTVDTTRQTYYEVPQGRKLEALGRVLDMETPGPTIVFCRTRQQCNELAESLRVRGYLAEPLHGEMGQPERDRVMKRFREGLADMLIATDVAARGLDIETVTHVINYELPWDIEQYIHRIGRTGRAGRSGDAITLVEGRERRQLQAIEKMIGTQIKPVRIPSAADITARRREALAESLRETLVSGEFDGHLATVESLTSEYDASEIAAAALYLLWKNRHSAPADTAEELANDIEQPEAGMVRLFVSLGRQDNVRPGDLVGAITNEAGLTGRQIGAIDIMDRTSFVEVPANFVSKVVAALNSTTLRGKSFNAGIAHPDENPRGNNRGGPPSGGRGGFGGGNRGPGGGGGGFNKYNKR
jgi:ATP-dependent RNA helicase DeaD